MTDDQKFTESEHAALRSLAEMLGDQKVRDELRRLVQDGATLREIILAYQTHKRLLFWLKAIGTMIVLAGAVVAVFQRMWK